jgi:hypothetical protein
MFLCLPYLLSYPYLDEKPLLVSPWLFAFKDNFLSLLSKINLLLSSVVFFFFTLPEPFLPFISPYACSPHTSSATATLNIRSSVQTTKRRKEKGRKWGHLSQTTPFLQAASNKPHYISLAIPICKAVALPPPTLKALSKTKGSHRY